MKTRYLAIFVVAVGLLSACTSVFAHHGSAVFDVGKKATMKGTVTDWFWANPHCFLRYDVKGADGQVVHWVAEASNPPDMLNRGWSKGSFKPGDQITVTLEPVKNGEPNGRIIEAVTADGKSLRYLSGGIPTPGN